MSFSINLDLIGVEMFKKTLDQGQAGDNVGLLLRSVKREDILRGQVYLNGKLHASSALGHRQTRLYQNPQ